MKEKIVLEIEEPTMIEKRLIDMFNKFNLMNRIENFNQLALVDPTNPDVPGVLKTLNNEVEKPFGFHKMSKIKFCVKKSIQEL